MKTLFLFMTLVLLTTSAGEAQAGKVQTREPRLFYRLRPGETYYLETDLQQNTHSESLESEEISFYNLTRLEFTVDSLDSEHLIYMSVKYRDLMISMLAPQLDIDISSASGKNQMLTEMVDMLEQSAFHMVMTPSGQLVNLDGLEEIFTPLASLTVSDTTEQEVVLETLEEAYGPDAFKSLCNLFVWIYPVIHPMTNWTNDITYYFNTKAVNMINRYNLTKSTDEIMVIQGMGMLNSVKEFYETTEMGEVKSNVQGSQTYDFKMDLETGWLQRCNSRQRVIIETTIVESNYFPSGLKIPSFTETVFEVKGGRLEQAIDIKPIVTKKR
jgi:hypothetical protein